MLNLTLTKTLMLGLAPLTLASPILSRQDTPQPILVQNSSASDYPGYVVRLVPGSNDNYWYLGLFDPSEYNGNIFSVVQNQTDPSNYEAIVYNVDGVPFGAQLPEIGASEGIAEPVTAYKNYSSFVWQFDEDKRLYTKLQDALDSLYICEVPSLPNPVLSYGHYAENGSLPQGCVDAAIYSGVL